MRSLPPQLSFADLELQFQGVQLDPLLRTIAEFLDQHLTLVEQVRKDLERGLKNARTGRNGIVPSQVLRSLEEPERALWVGLAALKQMPVICEQCDFLWREVEMTIKSYLKLTAGMQPAI